MSGMDVVTVKRSRERSSGPGALALSRMPFKSPARIGTIVSAPRYQASQVQRGYTRVGGYYGRFNTRGRVASGQAGSELKFFDTALSIPFDLTAEVPATGGQINLIPQGVTESTRVGRKCVLKSIHLKGDMLMAPAAGAGSCTVFLYLVLDKQCNGAAAGVTDVLTSASLNSALTNLENSDRFQILKKFAWSFTGQAGAAAAVQTVSKNMEYYKKVNIPIEYDSSASTGAIGTIRSNNVFLIAGSSVLDDIVTLTGVCRVRFSDN